MIHAGKDTFMASKPSSASDAESIQHDFLNELLQLEKLYAHELLGAKSERRSKVLELINKAAAKLHRETPKD
jgi:hypothetical protein